MKNILRKWMIKRLFKNRMEVIRHVLSGEETFSILNALYRRIGTPVSERGDDDYIEISMKKCCTRLAEEFKNRK